MKNINEDLKVLLAKPNETIREHTDKVKKSCDDLKELEYISEKMYTLLNLACEYHDYGKVNKEFQSRIKNNKKFNENKEVGHNILSTLFLKDEDFTDKNDYYLVLLSVLNHHHYVENLKVLKEDMDLSLELLKDYPIKKIKRRTIDSLEEVDSLKADVLTGLLNKCDYSGSGNYPVEYKNNFLIESLNSLNYEWNPLQTYLIENRDENLIVVANTGMGKTEGGLLWVGDNKGFFILPLRSAINSIYERIIKDIIKCEIEKKVVLMHSEAFDFYLSNYGENKKFIDIKSYFQEGKNLSIPLTISTLDQLFNFIFMYPGAEVKLATLSYSKVVLDEIQAYSPDLLAYIVIGLKRIKDIGGKFAILTATLPPFIREYLEKDIGKIKYKTFIQGETRHNIKVIDKEIESLFIYNKYMEQKNKTLVICNTIRKAQEIYDNLIELGIPKCEIELLHSKFIKKDRLKKESEILNFGKTEFKGEKIWISTSLVEASLDIDFDTLYTELNNLSGLFQRLGRVNRKGSKKITSYNGYIFTQINKNLFINGDKGFIDKDIFDLSKVALSEINGELTEEKKYKLMEKYLTFDKLKSSNFNEEFKRNKQYMEMIWKGKFSKKEVDKKFRNIISYKVIPFSVYEENENEILELLGIYNSEKGEKKELAKIKINSYTLSVGVYEKENFIRKINLDYEEINLIKGSYSYEKGFEKLKEEKKVEDFNCFI